MRRSKTKVPTAKKVNWAAARSSIAPDGVYECEVLKATFGESKQGNEKVTFEWKQADGDGNRHFFHDYSMLPTAIWALRIDLQAMGCDATLLEDEDADPEDAIQNVMGNRCALRIGHHEYEGREFNDVLAVMEV